MERLLGLMGGLGESAALDICYRQVASISKYFKARTMDHSTNDEDRQAMSKFLIVSVAMVARIPRSMLTFWNLRQVLIVDVMNITESAQKLTNRIVCLMYLGMLSHRRGCAT